MKLIPGDHMKKTIKDSTIKNYLGGIYAFVFAIAASLLVFFICAQNEIDENSQNSMRNDVSRQSEHLYSVLETHFQYMNVVAAQIGKTGADNLTSDENMELLVTLQKDTDLEHTALISANGMAHYETGKYADVSNRRYFQEGMSGKQTLSDPLESRVDQETRVVLGVPVYSGSEVIGVLGGSYNVTALSHTMFNDTFGGVGYTLIVTKEGDIIAYDGDDTYRKLSYGDNFFEFFSQKKFTKDNELDVVRTDFENGKDGIIKMKNPGYNQDMQYMAYTSVGMNDWMICYVIPVSAAQKQYHFIVRNETVLMVLFFIFVAVFAGYLVKKSGKKNAELIRKAQTDQLTGLYNKAATENLIGKYVADAEKKHQGTFFIMDIDHFKGINDNYGHLVGDIVLKQFAQFLSSNIPDNAIAGRIGGDEFVVFVPQLSDKKQLCDMAESLVKKASQLKFDEMDRGISISVGVAFCPEYGNSFMELYRNADSALYESKRNGKNQYTLCSN